MKKATSEIREVMDIRQAAEYLGISADSLYRYAAEGLIPAFKLGNRWRFKRSRLDAWMDQASSAGAVRGTAATLPAERPKPVASVRPARVKRVREAAGR